MPSGGLEISGYDVSLRYLPNNPETMRETIAGGTETVAETVASVGEEIADTARFVYDWYAEDSSRMPLAIPGVNLAAILLGVFGGCKKSATPTNVDGGMVETIPSPAQWAKWRHTTPDGRTFDSHNFDQLFKVVPEATKRKSDHSSLKNFGTCIKYFSLETCINMHPLDKSNLKTDDTDAGTAFMLTIFQMRAEGETIPSLTSWDPNVFAASETFGYSAQVLYDYTKKHPNFHTLRTEFISGLSKIIASPPASKIMCEWEIFNMMSMIGARPTTIDTPLGILELPTTVDTPWGILELPTTIDTPWRALDAYSSGPTWAKDWTTPLIHAGAVLSVATNYVNIKYTELKNKLNNGEWRIINKGGKPLIKIGKGAKSRSVTAFEYNTSEIWADTGTNIYLLHAEIENAINKARERCPSCIPSEEYVRNLNPSTSDTWNFQTVIIANWRGGELYAAQAAIELFK